MICSTKQLEIFPLFLSVLKKWGKMEDSYQPNELWDHDYFKQAYLRNKIVLIITWTTKNCLMIHNFEPFTDDLFAWNGYSVWSGWCRLELWWIDGLWEHTILCRSACCQVDNPRWIYLLNPQDWMEENAAQSMTNEIRQAFTQNKTHVITTWQSWKISLSGLRTIKNILWYISICLHVSY